jgi:hypothetical protein
MPRIQFHTQFSKFCPNDCGTEMFYKQKNSLVLAIKLKTVCPACFSRRKSDAMTGNKNGQVARAKYLQKRVGYAYQKKYDGVTASIRQPLPMGVH